MKRSGNFKLKDFEESLHDPGSVAESPCIFFIFKLDLKNILKCFDLNKRVYHERRIFKNSFISLFLAMLLQAFLQLL